MSKAEERAKRSHERKVSALCTLHTDIRVGGAFKTRLKSAQGFWKRKDFQHEIGEGETKRIKYGLDGWAAALADWTTRDAFNVTPQAVDILLIATECKHWPNASSRDRVSEICEDVRARMQARYDAGVSK